MPPNDRKTDILESFRLSGKILYLENKTSFPPHLLEQSILSGTGSPPPKKTHLPFIFEVKNEGKREREGFRR